MPKHCGSNDPRIPFCRRVRHWAEYLAFRVVVCLLQALSPRRARSLAQTLAFLIHHVLPRKLTRYEVARQNLQTAFGTDYTNPQIDRMIYEMWVHLFRVVVEMVQLPRKMKLTNIEDVIVFRNKAAVVRALCSGRPVILLSGHYGNWETACAVFGLFGFPMGVVARELDNPHMNEWFRKCRESTGHWMIAKKGGYEDILATVERGGSLAMLGDQDAGSRGLFVEFFGRDASTFKSIALLAVQYRALICVGYARRLKDDFERHHWVRYELGCEEVIDPLEFTEADMLRQITQRYTSALERAVRRSPEQYFWLHRRWKSVPRRKQRREAIQRKAG